MHQASAAYLGVRERIRIVRHILQVEAHARMTVKEIFEQEGEEAFREVETAVLQVAVIHGGRHAHPVLHI